MQEKFHQYNLITELAKKYSHTTYLASPANSQEEHEEPEPQVVLTIFSASLFRFPYERENLLQKVQNLKRLQHSHLAPILDMGVEEEQPFVVREYLPNGSLRSRLKKISPSHLELVDTLTIVSQIGEALIYAHEHGIVHCNIKPENVLFGANDQVFLTDFHLVTKNDALIRDQASEEYAFCYIAPEQFTGACDMRSDQYALGCLMYELITGHVPFSAQTLASMIGRPNDVLPAPLSASVPDLPASFEAAVLKALAKDPNERFFDFSLFLEVIQSVLSPPPEFPLFRSSYSRRRKIASYPAQPAKAKIISSSKHNYVAPELFETSEALFKKDDNIVEAAREKEKYNSSSSILVEPIIQSAALSSEQAMIAPNADEELDDAWLNNPFRKEDVDRLLRLASSESLMLGQSQSGTGLMSSSLTSVDLPRSWAMQAFHNKRGVIGLTLVLSMVVALFTYAFWPSGMIQINTKSHSADDIIQGIIPKISIQTGSTPIGQGSNRVANDLASQGATDNTKVLPSSQTSIKENAVSSLPSPNPAPVQSSNPAPAQSSSSAPAQSPTQTINMTIYFSGWTDDNGANIAYPQIHSTAGGTGTYSDPITFSASKNALSPGTIIYVSYLKKYFMMEDDCDNCDSVWNNNHTYQISLWTGGDSNSSKSAQQSCEDSLTPNSLQPVQVKPSSSNAVNTTPLFTDSGGCIKL